MKLKISPMHETAHKLPNMTVFTLKNSWAIYLKMEKKHYIIGKKDDPETISDWKTMLGTSYRCNNQEVEIVFGTLESVFE